MINAMASADVHLTGSCSQRRSGEEALGVLGESPTPLNDYQSGRKERIVGLHPDDLEQDRFFVHLDSQR